MIGLFSFFGLAINDKNYGRKEWAYGAAFLCGFFGGPIVGKCWGQRIGFEEGVKKGIQKSFNKRLIKGFRSIIKEIQENNNIDGQVKKIKIKECLELINEIKNEIERNFLIDIKLE